MFDSELCWDSRVGEWRKIFLNEDGTKEMILAQSVPCGNAATQNYCATPSARSLANASKNLPLKTTQMMLVPELRRILTFKSTNGATGRISCAAGRFNQPYCSFSRYDSHNLISIFWYLGTKASRKVAHAHPIAIPNGIRNPRI
jgi:hypothetical protein